MSGPSPSFAEEHAGSRAAGSHPYLRVHAVNIFVRDQEKSLRFYLDQLGFELAFDARLQSGDRWVAVAPPDGSALLTLVTPDPESEEYKLIGRPTPVVFVTDDVPAKYREWRQRGVRFRHTPRLRRVRYDRQVPRPGAEATSGGEGGQEPIWGGVFTRFEDIDRNSFALVSFDEVTQEVEAKRRAAAEKLERERRAAQELEIAKRVQAGLFPQILPPLATLDYAGICLQAREVGGDYYDFLNLGPGRVGLAIGDVSGKGIAAALLMANLQANLRSQCAVAPGQPERLLKSVNRLFCQNTTESAYATLFYAEYEDEARRLRYSNCGHVSALLLRADNSLERLNSTGTVLGLFDNLDCEVGELQLTPGDTLVLYTDGVTESFNSAGEEFGEERLIATLRGRLECASRELLAAIVEELHRFGGQVQRDDITLMVARCRSGEAAPARRRT